MTNPDYRAMCAVLIDALDNLLALVNGECPSLLDGDRGGSGFLAIEIDDALTTARALLAQPVAEEPSASDVTELFYRHMGEGSEVGFENAIAEALARWGRPTLQPVAVSERLQQLEDLAADAVSGLRYIEQTHGRLYGVGWDRVYEKADRLQPAHALPTPEATND